MARKQETTTGAAVAGPIDARLARQPGVGQKVLRFARSKPLGALGGLLIIVLVVAAIFAGVISPYDPVATKPVKMLTGPGSEFFLGSDQLGRDLLSRLIHGSRVSLYVGILAVCLGTTAGTAFGVVGGYLGGALDLVFQRLMDALMAFPLLVLAMALVAMLGPSLNNVTIALAILLTPGTSRVIRGAVLSVKENQYIEAARAMGASDGRIIFRHVLPNVAAPIIVLVSIQLGGAILVEASLSFLGLGVPPPAPSWGGMLSGAARSFFQIAPWMAIFPGIAISLAVLGFNLLGDALRDVLDPRMRGSEKR